jgi:hypothetical protein
LGARNPELRDGPRNPKNRRRWLAGFLAIAAIAGVVAAAVILLRETPDHEGQRAFENLVGRWVRPDGGYVMEIRGVDVDGKMDLAYLNPRPINVAHAKASREGGMTKLFVELRDEGYPGSTYTLSHDPQRHTLRGIYFQAAMGQRFEVLFVRMK